MDDMDAGFRALADPSRRRLLDSLNARGGQNLSELCAGLNMTRQSVSKHLAVLEAANLAATVRRGREKLHYLNAGPINDIADRWINNYHVGRLNVLADLKRTVEDTSIDKPDFVYTTYIRTTPEALWHALTQPEFTRQWWGATTIESDWKVGSPMTWTRGGVTVAHPGQVVLESEPYRRLSYRWQAFAALVGIDEDLGVAMAKERLSTVAFDLEKQGQVVKLTVAHGDFDPGSVVLGSITNGWPRVLSDLKTLLETGAPL